MNDLERYFTENTGKLIHKWKHYFEIYDRHFSRFRGKEVHIVEFGVYKGGSLQMWKNYFGKNAKIYGVDINPHCKDLEEEQIEIFIGNQEDREFLRSLVKKIPRIDIVIEDGGHTMEQQILTYEELFSSVDENGVYLCEDIHTSYWPDWGGGYKRPGTFIEYSKNFIDYLHAWHSVQKRRLDVTEFTKSVGSIHYYDSIIVIEKKIIEKPASLMSGTPTIPDFSPPKNKNLLKRIQKGLKLKMYPMFNKCSNPFDSNDSK